MKKEIIRRLELLRAEMRNANIQATIVPRTDPHHSEYLAEHWHTVKWLTSFTGSAGTLVVTLDRALLWVDSRYFLQAAEQLDGTTIEMMKDGLKETPSTTAFLIDALPQGSTVGIDGMLFSISEAKSLGAELAAGGMNLTVDFSPMDKIWADRPLLPDDKVFIHPVEYAGETASSKIAKVLDNARAQGADSTLISDLAEVAWTLNLRCRDVECNPVATAYLFIAADGSTLFIDPRKLTDETTAYLAENNVKCAPYTEVADAVKALSPDRRVLISEAQTSHGMLHNLGDKAVVGTSPVAMLKATKNEIQIEGMRRSMTRDGIALVKSFIEIEQRVERGDNIDELEVANILVKYRSQQPLFFDTSFETIAGFGPHGAIVHYSATPESSSRLTPDNLLLVDSGAQYLDGTTDITRTITLGETTDEQRRDFTLVMKGYIALDTAIYPAGTRGVQLDILARKPLWDNGMTYLHGTGHGVGQFLNVHEGPQTIRMNDTFIPLVPGMITSNEPGLYLTDKWGIRCENLVLTVPAFTNEFGEFLKFETLTMFPFDLRLFDTSIMTDAEIEWVNNYHATVYERLSPALDEEERQWLKEKTKELTR